MSSADTLNFGPQWLRDLSEGPTTSSSTSPPTPQIMSATKFKLAEFRYGREELLALFVEDSEVPEELQRAPSLVSEIVQLPLALRLSNEHSQAPLSTSFRGRGGGSSVLRGRSIPSRGRGRGRGISWADHDDSPLRRPPLLRRAESEDWRGDSLRGKGDGAEDIMGGLKEWRTATGQRTDFWKDTWRDRPGDATDQRYSRGRSLSSRDAEDADRRWRDNGFDDAAANSKKPDASRETMNGGKEQTKHKDTEKDKKESISKDAGGMADETPITNNSKTTNGPGDPKRLSEKSTSENISGRLQKTLEPVAEAMEIPETGQGGSNVVQNVTPPKTEESVEVVPQNNNPLEDMFQKLTANDSGGGAEKISVSQLFQEAQKSEPQPVSSQSLPFSNNSPLGDDPTTSNSSIAQLQALASKWYYKDPQGEIQGAFSSTQMMEWFNAGYFTMVLLIKRACDTEFSPLGELIKRWGHVPFTSASKSVFPNVPASDATSSGPSLLPQNNYTEQQQQMQYAKLLQGQKHQQQQSQQLQHQNLQQQQVQQQRQQLQQQQPTPIGRSYQQQADFEAILSKLLKNQDFCRLSPQHQQHVVLQYAEDLKRQSLAAETTRGLPLQTPAVTSESTNLLGVHQHDPITTQYQQQQKKLMEEAQKKEEEIWRIKQQQEEQKEMLRKQEEEFQRKKKMLMREEEQIKQLQLEAQRKKEELHRKLEEEERMRKAAEMQEMERRRRLEEEERRRQQEERERKQAELIRIQQEEEERRRKEERRRLEEEEARRLEQQRQELRRLEIEREQRMQEEKRRQEEQEKLLAKEADMKRKAEAARIQKEKEAEAKAILKKQQQEKQMQQMQLPSHARWGDNQPQSSSSSSKNDSLSLIEIQKIEKREEKTRLQEEARMVREIRHQVPKPKTGWGNTKPEAQGVSLLDIQREEAKQMSLTKTTVKPEKVPNLGFNTSWNKPPKIQPDPPKSQSKPQASFWDQVVEENPQKSKPPRQNQKKQQQKQTKQQPKGAKQKGKSDEGQQVKALFQQQITKDGFTDWCEGYLQQMSVGSIDIPTFVNFLRDVESSYEVQEYVQSYLGESKEAKDFTTLFLEQRAVLGGYKYKSPQTNMMEKPNSATARDTDGFEVVTSNTKRGKKKLKKIQKVDPSILGFSVNAASDRVNMGEIQTADD